RRGGFLPALRDDHGMGHRRRPGDPRSRRRYGARPRRRPAALRQARPEKQRLSRLGCAAGMVDPQDIRHDWTATEIEALLELPLLDLLYRAQTLHRRYQDGTVQLASLLSIKTGGCPEDCAYCPQSAHYAADTGVARERLMPVDAVLAAAR